MKDATAKLTLAAGLAAGGVLAFASTVGAQGIGVDELERMRVPTDRKIERGEAIYQNQCAGCHGADGEGNVEYPADQFAHAAPDFTAAEYRHGGGLVQNYNVISKGLAAVASSDDGSAGSGTDGDGGSGPSEGAESSSTGEYHPTYTNTLRYQERWAVSHYLRSLAEDPSALPEDPPEVLDQARLDAKRGTCNPEVKTTIASRVEPKGDKQLEKGKKLYQNNCTSCHGESGKGDGPAGQALEPAPRNFHATDVEWTKGTSPLNIFNVLSNGIEGTAMSSYASMSEEERWALTHYVRQWIPEQKRQPSTDQDIMAVCRTMSKPEPPESITVDQAVDALIADQPENREMTLARYGPVEVAPEANAERGKQIYQDKCAKCHGDGLQGATIGPLAIDRAPSPGLENPELYIDIRGLRAGHAGGTFRHFATRAASGVHATLPGMTSASLLSEQDWKDLQAYIASSVEGDAEIDTLRGDQTAPGDGSPSGAGSETSTDPSDSDSTTDSQATATDGQPQQETASPSENGRSSDQSDDANDETATDR